jgi:hypothetical protein
MVVAVSFDFFDGVRRCLVVGDLASRFIHSCKFFDDVTMLTLNKRLMLHN